MLIGFLYKKKNQAEKNFVLGTRSLLGSNGNLARTGKEMEYGETISAPPRGNLYIQVYKEYKNMYFFLFFF